AGDRALREAAARLRAARRPEDLLARCGGEEFVAMGRVRETTELTMIDIRIRELMEATPSDCAGTSVPVTISAGCPRPAAARPRAGPPPRGGLRGRGRTGRGGRRPWADTRSSCR
ncbi:diguanylate cyclase, partial [Pseudomonas aeruginosa]|nr:diguanylate cyclase [Pseudomonas aeruginosa]